MRARSWPFRTWSLKSTSSSETCPETCVPTLTVVTAWRIPVAETWAWMSPRSTVAKRNAGVGCANANWWTSSAVTAVIATRLMRTTAVLWRRMMDPLLRRETR